ncbi:MAG TPA: asparagine synthase (glutamine-hydrolyzing) [Candidatus Ozemobacteraceae bacterium]|nr:asparagine synthase (glutamine-hydrolyzing) [Candidatus Ozemobacteraceae bacterium]
MCGITGFVDFRRRSHEHVLKNMTSALAHRGPDNSGLHFLQTEKAHIGLGHRRLSIIDLSSLGHQPMAFEKLSIIFNGEIYNFAEIKKELEECGYSFASHSDTEVVLKAYHCWGVKAVEKLIGMFAIAILDQSVEKLTLLRDRAGVKPLFWYCKDGLFLFSSELKSFHQHPDFCRDLNMNSLALYLQYGYVPQPHCIFKDTQKLRSGHFLELNLKNREISEVEYWDVEKFYTLPKLAIGEHDAFEETEKLLKSAFNYRMLADVPVGIFLSGGYDSSLVTAMLQSDRSEKLKTFTIGFHEEKFNEAHHARKVAEYLGTDHTECFCTQQEALEILPQLPFIYDEPFGDSSAIPTTLVSRLARQKVTVSLSADGGDEIFAGYGKYTSLRSKLKALAVLPSLLKPALKGLLTNSNIHRLATSLGIFNADDRLNRFALMLDSDEKELLSIGSSFWTRPELRSLLTNTFTDGFTGFHSDISQDWLSNVLAIDYKTYMVDDILTKVDRATMSVSLEGREPLLDHRIIEFVAQLPSHFKLRKNSKKFLLKEITHKYLPKEIMNRPKMGFGVPITEWFKKDLKGYFLNYLDSGRLKKAGIFNATMVENLRERYFTGDQANVSKLWFLLMFEMWREKWC